MDKYDIGPVVGKGSFGVVVLVTRREDGEQFVMKRLPIQKVTEKEMEAYQNEIRLLSELEHPGIVCYMESFVDRVSMDLCIVMQFCSGGDMTLFIKTAQQKGAKLSESEIKHHFIQMALALHFMHEKNILHRDLKTGNIFFLKPNGLIQLGDFGISKVLNGASDLAQTCIGTPYYMSPELFKNKPYNHKSDVWALGCILYELTSLKHAFDAMNINGLANKVIHGIYPPIATSYSKDLRELIKSMLGVTPSSRPSIKQILLMPSLYKPIKKYIKHILSTSSDIEYRPAHVLNLKNQLDRIGAPLSGIFAEVEKEKKASNSSGTTEPKSKPLKKNPLSSPNELYDDDDPNVIDRTLVAAAAPSSSSSAKSKDDLSPPPPPTVRRKPKPSSKPSTKRTHQQKVANENVKPPITESRYNLGGHFDEMEREHQARMAELQAEEAAKQKLEKEFERVQALQVQRAKHLQQRKAQLQQKGGQHNYDASTASTSKDSSITSAGSSGGSSALPIISSASSSNLSPQPPLHNGAPTSPGLSASISSQAVPSLPALNSSRSNSRNPSPSLHPNRVKGPQIVPASSSTAANNPSQSASNRSASPATTSSATSPTFFPAMPLVTSQNGVVMTTISPTGSTAPSPRNIVKRTPTSASAISGAETSAEAKDLSPPPAASGPTADNLKLLKRKVAVSRSQLTQINVDASPPPLPVSSNSSSSPEIQQGRRVGRPRTNRLPFPTSAAPVNPAPPPSTDIEATLQHEKDELERLRIERTRLEELLTRMDEEHHLFVGAESPRAAAPAPTVTSGMAALKVKSPPLPSTIDEPSPRQSKATFSSSTSLPSAFDAPLIYKARDRNHATNNTASSNGAISQPHLRRVISYDAAQSHAPPTGAPVPPRPGRDRQHLAPSHPSGSSGPIVSSTKDRILAAKAAKKTEEASVEQARLLAARKEYFTDRVKAEQRTRDFYGQGNSNTTYDSGSLPAHILPMNRGQSDPTGSGGGYSSSPVDDAPLLIYDDAHLVEHLNSDLLPIGVGGGSVASSAASLLQEEEELSASSLEVEEFQMHLAQYTRRIEKLRSVIEVTSASTTRQGKRPTAAPIDDEEEEEDDESGSDDVDDYSDHDGSPSPPLSSEPPITNLEDRKKALAKECVNLVGRDIFIAAYDFLASVQNSPALWEDDIDDQRKLDRLLAFMGKEKLKHWKLIDQLLFLEAC